MTKIQLRRDTAANWSTNNPTPSAGEPCFETDTGKLKIGDGITAYNSLPYQGGAGDVTSTGNNTFTGTNIFKGKSLNVGDDNNYSDIAGFTGAEYAVGDQKDTTIVNPLELGASYNNTVLKSNVRVLETDTASSTKKAYSIMTKSPVNNEYMAHMAMPSNKYIDLELGASGTTYTAPADGYVYLNTEKSNDYMSVTIDNKTAGYMVTSSDNKGWSIRILMPVRKNDTFQIRYGGFGSQTIERFIYAVGSEPSS